MKRFSSYIFLGCMVVLMVGSYWFSQYKNQARTVSEIEINFTSPALLLAPLLVNKLLTQNLDQQSKKNKESLDLNMLEAQLKRTPEIKNAEVFKLPQGGLSVEVTERKPLFIVESDPPYFGDEEGILFKYKTIDSLSFPVFKKNSIDSSLSLSAALISRLKKDPLLASELEVISLEDNHYTLELRSFPFKVILGDASQLNEKLEKLKVFCAFQLNQDSLKGYDKINLSYDKQVVATTL